MLQNFYIAVFFGIYFQNVRGDQYANNFTELDKGYGDSWIFFPDGNLIPKVMLLRESNDTYDNRLTNKELLIEFHLFTRKNVKDSVMFYMGNGSNDANTNPLNKKAISLYNPKKETKIISHGWMSNGESVTSSAIKDAYLENRDCNVIIIDWEELASNIIYTYPMRDTKIVGEKTAKLIDFLVKSLGAKTTQMHVIGHSLGAHVAGYVGSFVKSGKIDRITGLDPALPGFKFRVGPKDRLDPTDATFVDVIHTCGGTLGYSDSLGHVDFYPNAGIAAQPGCCCFTESILACSHGRAHEFFAESIGSKIGFLSYKCDSWWSFKMQKCPMENPILMGDKTPKAARGTYYLETDGTQPFALGNFISLPFLSNFV